ncbi:MAG: PBP1A family penicillin-binding protein [Actinobacteria bacterium]|nr:PBP1A family penicillin-binding protein [Actinomycetota bacterium]
MRRRQRFTSCVTAIMLVIVASGCAVESVNLDNKDPEPAPLSLRSHILAADGTELATLFVENRQAIAYEHVPKQLIDAVVAAEDQRFFSHHGFDVRAVLRAIRSDAAGNSLQGGSTITEQYVKNTYFPINRKRTLAQKIKEARLAWKVEHELTKRQIMERYLNTVYLGDGAYGVQAAAQEFFTKDVAQLTVAESATIAGAISGPETYNPRRHAEVSVRRRDHVIDRMLALHSIDNKVAEAAKANPLTVSPRTAAQVKEPYFVDWVKQRVMGDPIYGRDEDERASLLFRGGITVHTTLDLRLQQIARTAIDDILDRPGDPEAALISIEPKTGHVVAMIGGRDYGRSQVNLSLGSLAGGLGRQPGSAFKPFVLATAFEDGYTPSSRLSSTPGRLRTGRKTFYDVNNNEGTGNGDITLEDATVHSVNAVFVRLGLAVGLTRVTAMAHRIGIDHSVLHPYPSLPLGTSEVSPLEMASGFSTFANYGLNVAPTPISSIDTAVGDQVANTRKYTRALDPGVAYLVTKVLEQVVERGTGTKAQLDRPAAGKTGTTNDYSDAWFVGYTPELVTAVWVGYPNGLVPMRNVHGIHVFGGTFPAMIWRAFMQRALSGTPAQDFQIPTSDLITIDIDPNTGLLAGPYCLSRQTVTMLRQLAPTITCPSPPAAPSPTAAPTATVTSTAQPSPAPSELSPTPSPSPS